MDLDGVELGSHPANDETYIYGTMIIVMTRCLARQQPAAAQPRAA